MLRFFLKDNYSIFIYLQKPHNKKKKTYINLILSGFGTVVEMVNFQTTEVKFYHKFLY